MNQVAKPEAAATPSTDLDAFVQMVERAAANPAVDVDKLERLLAMRERLDAQRAEQIFNAAMNDAQAEMQPIAADANNPQTKSKYASYFALDRALRPIYTRHGFALSFDEGESPKPEHVRVLCYVSHVGGHTRTYHRDMPADGKGAKGGDVMTKTHASGAAGTYGARYLLKGIFNVAIGEDDNDGNGPTAKISVEQVGILRAAIVETGADLPKFLKYFKIEKLDDLPASHFERAKQMLMQRAAKGGE
jgi:hypothetical protein